MLPKPSNVDQFFISLVRECVGQVWFLIAEFDDLRRFTQYLSWQIRRWAGPPFPGFSDQENEALKLKALHSCSLLVTCRG